MLLYNADLSLLETDIPNFVWEANTDQLSNI